MKVVQLVHKKVKKFRMGIMVLTTAGLLGPSLSLGQQKIVKVGAPVDRPLSAVDRQRAIEEIADLVVDNYIFPDMGERIAKQIRKRHEEGRYSAVTDGREFQEILTSDLREISKDPHLFLNLSGAVIQAEPIRATEEEKPGECVGEFLKNLPGFGRNNNYGFENVKRLQGNIGYLDLRVFDDPRNDVARATAEAAMAFLANSDAIIIDLRRNRGGTGEMANLLASYFFGDEPVHLLTNATRYKGETHTREDWTLKEVSGKRLPDIDLYLLTSNWTGSAAEHFTFALKGQDRATLVGESTAGAGHNVAFFPVLDRYDLSIPIGRTYNPISGKGWQETGIKPDVEVSAEEALEVAHREALTNLEKDAASEEDRVKIRWILEALNAVYNPFVIEEPLLQTYAGNYDNGRHITLKDGVLYYTREGMNRKHKLVPMSQDQFLLEGADELRLRFVEGDQPELHMIYEDGRIQKCNKTERN